MERVMKPARLIFEPDESFSVEKRIWQGCPTIERTKKGTIYTGWFSGGPYEPHPDNYNVVARSFDGGETWEEPFLVIAPVREESYRAIDVELWLDPDDRLWVLWTQTKVLTEEKTIDSNDGVFGVWAIVTENPDDEKPVWSEPRRLTDGFLRCKPTVLGNGEWVFPAYDWIHDRYAYYVTKDKGVTFEKRLTALKTERNKKMFDEPMIVEINDSTLWMLVRTIEGVARTVSTDGGKTWSELENPAFPGPCSRFFIGKLESGNILLVNHHKFTGRSHLTALLSTNQGESFDYMLLIDERSNVSYPDLVQDADGRIYLVYDRERHSAKEILMASFTEEEIIAGKLLDPDSYMKKIICKVP